MNKFRVEPDGNTFAIYSTTFVRNIATGMLEAHARDIVDILNVVGDLRTKHDIPSREIVAMWKIIQAANIEEEQA
jgi:hypothetical protein